MMLHHYQAEIILYLMSILIKISAKHQCCKSNVFSLKIFYVLTSYINT